MASAKWNTCARGAETVRVGWRLAAWPQRTCLPTPSSVAPPTVSWGMHHRVRDCAHGRDMRRGRHLSGQALVHCWQSEADCGNSHRHQLNARLQTRWRAGSACSPAQERTGRRDSSTHLHGSGLAEQGARRRGVVYAQQGTAQQRQHLCRGAAPGSGRPWGVGCKGNRKLGVPGAQPRRQAT